MRITIGANELEVLNAYAKRLASGKILVMVEVLQELISHDDFRALFKNTTEDLVIIKNDDTKETFGGCHYAIKVADDVKKEIIDGVEVSIEIHRAEIECSSEADFQLGRLRGDVNTHSQTLSMQNITLEEHAEVINAQGDAIVSHTQALESQETQVAGLTESSAMQSATMESILLEIIPAVISQAIAEATAQAVTKAVEQALEAVASSNTEEEYPEYDEDEQYSEPVEETTEKTETDAPEESTEKSAGETVEETTGDNPEVIEE